MKYAVVRPPKLLARRSQQWQFASAGGALSYEPAFYLVEKLYSRQHAERIGRGLVWEWSLSSVPHLIVTR